MAEKLCDKSCEGCIHLSHFYDDLTCCNYFITTGERRPCPPVRVAPSEKPSGRGRKETPMETSKLIETLRFCGDKESCCSQCPSGDRVTEYTATECLCDLMQKAADTIEALQAELRDEMQRHGRLQDLNGCCRCKDTSEMTVLISNKLIAGVRTGWLGGTLPAKFCPFCGRRLHQPPKGE